MTPVLQMKRRNVSSEPNVKLIDFFGVVLSPGAKGYMVGKVAFRHLHTIESKRSALMNKRKK